MKIINRFYNRFLPPLPEGDYEMLRKHKFFLITCLFTGVFAFAYGVLSYLIEFKVGLNLMILSVLFFGAQPFLLQKIPLKYLGVLVSLYIVWLNGMLVFYSGGLFVSPVSPWITLSAPIALLFTNYKTAISLVILGIFYVLAFSWVINSEFEFPFTYLEQYHLLFLALSFSGLVAIFFLVTNTFEVTKNEALNSLMLKQKELEAEQAHSESLLLNIFPEEVVKELKSTGKSEAKLHPEVTVLFADVKNFTAAAEKLGPSELVELIDRYFRSFDSVIHDFKLEKIKTIGDAYMAASGVPDSNKATVGDVLKAAIEMQKINHSLKQIQIDNIKPFFDFRIGIHTGPVVACVVGKKKFVYDIWGDTVNIAARIEQAGEPGKINISEFTYLQIKDDFNCSARGKIEAINKKDMEMYFVDYEN